MIESFPFILRADTLGNGPDGTDTSTYVDGLLRRMDAAHFGQAILPDNQLGDPTYADTHLNNFEFPASVELNMLEFRNHWLKNKDLYKTKLHSTNSYPDCPVFEDHDRSPASGKAKEVQSPLPREATHPKLCQNKTSK